MAQTQKIDYILYVRPNDPNSQRIVQILNEYKSLDNNEIWVQDIYDLKKRELWLDGTPYLVNVPLRIKYRGSEAFTVLTNYLADKKARAKPPVHQRPHQGPSLDDIDVTEPIDSRKLDGQPQKINEDTLADYMARREQQLR